MLARNALSCYRRRCETSLFHRSLAVEVSRDATSTTENTRTEPKHAVLIRTAIVMNRSPILTRTPTVFENAYYEYHARIRRALHNPFPYNFYFKHGSPLETKFSEEERLREEAAFGEQFGQEDQDRDREPSDEEGAKPADADETQRTEEEESIVLMPREHEADIKGDVKSLNRKGQRNLYLLLQGKDKEVWRFPQGGVEKGELLHQAAQRDLYAECGDRMDAWIVSRTPIGVYEEPTLTKRRNLLFFLKAHILGGQVHPDDKLFKDFAWLTKEEIEERVDKHYWLGVKDMLSDE